MTGKHDTYTSPLAERNASAEMLRLWSPRHKFNTWRRIWLAVAEAMHEIGQVGRARDGSALRADTPSAGPLVTKEQVEELRAVVERGITDEEIQNAEKYERELRHDVMAHVHALGDSCPKAKGIIHLGMTSQDVVCNADLLTINAALSLIEAKCVRVLFALAENANKYKTLPTLACTHFQPAQPMTKGRRIAQWAQEFMHAISLPRDGNFIGRRYDLKGLRGATGTQASYLELFSGDRDKVDAFEREVLTRLLRPTINDFELLDRAAKWAVTLQQAVEHRALSSDDVASTELLRREARFQREASPEQLREKLHRNIELPRFAISSQTYPRVIDTFILSDLAAVASVLHKIATDIRLLCNRKELDEPFESKQIGSSAMPYKRNPMRCERICGLTRFVMNLVGNAYDTAATQWLERTLDDSSNRRLSLPEAFLALDGALDLMHNVASGLIVHEAMVKKNLMAELPFLATENILMACVKLYVGFPGGSGLGAPTLRVGSRSDAADQHTGPMQDNDGEPTRSVGLPGGDRQHYHELIRVHAQAAGMRVKQEGFDNDLLERLKADRNFWSTARGGPLLEEIDWDNLMDPMKYIGRSVEQTERFIEEVVEPLRRQYGEAIAKLGDSGPRV